MADEAHRLDATVKSFLREVTNREGFEMFSAAQKACERTRSAREGSVVCG